MPENSFGQDFYPLLELLLSEAQEKEQNGDADGARSSYQEIIDSAQTQAEVAPNLDWETLIDKAKDGLSRLAGRDYQRIESLLGNAEDQEQARNIQAARSLYQRVAASTQEQSQTASGWDWDALLDKANAGLNRLDARSYTLQGHESLKHENYQEAIGLFRRAHTLDPNDLEAKEGLAEALYQSGCQREKDGRKLAARQDYEEALTYQPNHPGAQQARLNLANEPVARRRSLMMVVGLLLLAGLAGTILALARLPHEPPKTPPTQSREPDHPQPTLLTALPSMTSSPTVITTAPVVTQTASPSPLPETSPVVSVTAPATATVVSPLSITFSGRVLSQDGRPLARLRYIQLYGSETGDFGTRLLSTAITADDGEFSLTTAEDFPYYILWLEPAPLPPQMAYVSVSAGRGGEATGARAIRYRNPGSGVYDDNLFYVAFNTPTPTDTPKPTATRTKTPSPTPFPAPVLLSPEEGATASDQVTFAWDWGGSPLPPNYGFEVRLWKNDQPDHYGAAEATPGTRLLINLEGAHGVRQGGAGRYYWTVAVVKLQPYERIGLEATARVIDIGGGEPPPPPPSR